MLKAVIFDMDGVICDSEPLHMRAFQKVLQEHDMVLTDNDYYDHYLAFDDRGCFDAVFKVHQRTIDSELMKKLLAQKARYFDEAMKNHLVIYPGAEAIVRKAGEKFALALASGARRLEVEYVLKKAKIRGLFTAIVSADDVQRGKPDPESFSTALKLLNERRLQGSKEMAAGECLVIEDSLHGITAAQRAGMKCVAIPTSYEPAQLSQANLVVDSLVGLELKTLEELFG